MNRERGKGGDNVKVKGRKKTEGNGRNGYLYAKGYLLIGKPNRVHEELILVYRGRKKMYFSDGWRGGGNKVSATIYRPLQIW
jgi:hypothetical protein